jgi:hypothetical protein
MQTKEFLAQECENLESVLEETLRFKYGLEGSKEFFDECRVRLTFVKDELSKTNDADVDNLLRVSILLNQLSDLISRIERSSIGQYSWPFVEELKRIATVICTEATLSNPNTPPQFYVLSSGGLHAYAIQPEQNRPSGGSRRIHTIVFPRTLKHFVLLHSILGHEIGHAMWRCSKHQHALKQIVDRELFSSGVFANPSATGAHLYSATAPLRVKQQLAQHSAMNANNFFASGPSWAAWTEEILCDFIGLLTFGPSFVAAECNLLYAMDPAGTSLGPQHPPVGWRANYLLSAAQILGLTTERYAAETVKNAVGAFWTSLATKRQADDWFNVFTTQQITNTTDAIANLLRPLAPSLYVSPAERDLELLLNQLKQIVPPVGFETNEANGEYKIECRSMDFRYILFAGWITSASPSPITFAQLNRLCEHGIMQQRAIEMQIES